MTLSYAMISYETNLRISLYKFNDVLCSTTIRLTVVDVNDVTLVISRGSF